MSARHEARPAPIGSAALPVTVAARLRGRRGRVLLHSGRDDDQCGRWSFAACEPALVITARGDEITELDRAGDVTRQSRGAPLDVLQAAVERHAAGFADDIGGPVPVAFGYLGYELGHVIERIHARRRPRPMPDLWFGLYDAVWRHDRHTGVSDIIARTPAAARALADAIERGDTDLGKPPRLGALTCPDPDDAYRARVERILEYIRAGDVYQVNLARALVAPVIEPGDPMALYASLIDAAPAPFGAVLELAGPGEPACIVSGSPELFLSRGAYGRLETRPIKGTRRRTGDPVRDHRLAAELAADDKERAEHLMIVDLERNDLGRVARLGSVRVDALGYVVELPHLYHMVSRVSCRVRDDTGLAEIIRATFPGGSITGAPKRRAMEIIDELEPTWRGPYTGAIGYIGLRGAIDLSIATRTIGMTASELVLHVGGGIVADSRPDRELEETEEKAAGWRAALAATR